MHAPSPFFVVFNQEKMLILQKQASKKMRFTFLFSCRFHAQHCKRPPNTCLSLVWLSEEAEASMVWEDTVLRWGLVGHSGTISPRLLWCRNLWINAFSQVYEQASVVLEFCLLGVSLPQAIVERNHLNGTWKIPASMHRSHEQPVIVRHTDFSGSVLKYFYTKYQILS